MFWNLSSEHTDFFFNMSHEEYFSGTEYYAVDIKAVFRAFWECTDILVLKENVNLSLWKSNKKIKQ